MKPGASLACAVPGPRRALLQAGVLALLPLRTARAATRAASDWENDFERGLADWGPLTRAWGESNRAFLREPGVRGQLLRVHLPRGSIDPGSMRRRGLPYGGTGFVARVLPRAATRATLTYRLRFAPEFDFVRGGKLPGLCAGSAPSGGTIPDGRDGASFRLMWRAGGAGEVYAYLPTSQRHGSSLLRGRLHFTPGRWHTVRQEVVLNTPGQADGRVALWLDGDFIGAAGGLRMRDVPQLALDGVFFEVFFGGNDDSWAARADTWIDFAEFAVRIDDGATAATGEAR